MTYNVIGIATAQVIGDLTCCFLSLVCSFKANKNHRVFFITNSVAFFILAFGDIYYNYLFRILNYDIQDSVGFIVTSTMLIFHLTQAYNWHSLIKQQNTVIFSKNHLPYISFIIMAISVLVYYFLTGYSPSIITTWYQIASVSLDMLIWFFGIVCLARTRSLSIILLTFGCLMVISADLTTRCLYMLDINRLGSIQWIHIAWVIGVLIMAVGFELCRRNKRFKFCHSESIQATCSAWMLITSLAVFIIGILFLLFFNLTYNIISVKLTIWNLPIALMFTMTTSVLLGNWFSNYILLPVDNYLKRIQSFNLADNKKIENHVPTKIYEFKVLGEFIDNSFKALSTQLDREIKMAAQVAHDIRSPLSALEIVIKRLPEIDETKRVLLRDAIHHIRDITNNLEKTIPHVQEYKLVTQVATLIDYVLSERRAAFANQPIEICHDFSPNYYNYFIEVVPSEMRRVLSNIINNACEAVLPEGGFVKVNVTRDNNVIKIAIKDNGSGISDEVLTALFKLGYTTKEKGSGLGLYHAKESLDKWGGTIELTSDSVRGCTALIGLPAKTPPSWIITSLSFFNNSRVVCVDDSISIWHAWQERFRAMNGEINLIYCRDREELIREIKEQGAKHSTYLVDYEFSGKYYTGFDLINLILESGVKGTRIYLVTSHSSELEIQKFCEARGIYIIPKRLALIIPLRIINSAPKQIVLINHIDNLPFQMRISESTEEMVIYFEINDFLADLTLFNKESEVYIQNSLFNDTLKKIINDYGIQVHLFEKLKNLPGVLNAQLLIGETNAI